MPEPRCYIDDCGREATLVIHSYPDDVRLCDEHKSLHEPGDVLPGDLRCTRPRFCEMCDG